ncbi:MAG: hypothetical protein ACI4QV_03560 [Acutalibacteraceae bacterium]
MDIKIINGDFALDSFGRPKCIFGGEELLQRISNCLKIRKGSFTPNPEIGSRLYMLEDRSDISVKQMCESALANIEGIKVISAFASFDGEKTKINLEISADNSKKSYEVIL